MSNWDSSALVKLYTKEPDSEVFEEFAAGCKTGTVISRLGIFEIATTLHRKESEGALAPGAAQEIHQRLIQDCQNGNVRIIEFSANVDRPFQQVLARCFEEVPPQLMRTLDAIHLASALSAGESQLISTDERLSSAARFLGLKVFP